MITSSTTQSAFISLISFCVNKSDRRYCKKATPIEPLQAHLKFGCIPRTQQMYLYTRSYKYLHRWHQVTLMGGITGGGTGFCIACCKINRRNPLLRHGWLLQWWSKWFQYGSAFRLHRRLCNALWCFMHFHVGTNSSQLALFPSP